MGEAQRETIWDGATNRPELPEVVVQWHQRPEVTLLECTSCDWRDRLPAASPYGVLQEHSQWHIRTVHFPREPRPFWTLQAESMYYSAMPDKNVWELRRIGQLQEAIREQIAEVL